MKVSEAPRSGWYPDPEGGARLRWWDGTDWSDRYRSRPDVKSAATIAATEEVVAAQTWPQVPSGAAQVPPATAAIVEQVRMAARAEAERAAEDFTRRAREVTGAIPPLISQYTNKFMRYLRYALALTFVVLMLWLAYQIFLQQSLFDWIGDRIDNLTDENATAASVEGWVTRA